MPDSEHGTTTDTTSSDDQDEKEGNFSRKRRKGIINVKVKGGNGNFAIGPKAKVVTNQGQRDSYNVSKVLEHFETFLKDVADSRGPEKDQMECFVLTEMLPYIEGHAMRNGGNCIDTLEILARLSSPTLRSPRITKYALKLLDKFIAIDIGRDETNAHLVQAEKCLRKPIVDGSFRTELIHDQRRRIDVYCNVLTAMLIGRAKERLAYPYEKIDKEEIAKCKLETEKTLRWWPLPRKDRKRLSLEIISCLLERLLDKTRMHERLKKLLDSCESMLKDGVVEEGVGSIMKEVSRTESGAVDLFVIIKVLHAKLINQPRAYELFKAITMRHPLFSSSWSAKRERDDWFFALLACQIFMSVTVSHNAKATRIDAAQRLESFCSTKAHEKSIVINAIVTKYITKATFAHDVESRRILLGKRHEDELQEKISLELLRKRICTSNQEGYLEISDTICENEKHVMMRGRYNDKPVAVKMISLPVSRLLAAQDCQGSEEMENEISVRRSLETSEHVPLTYAADTNDLPYHFIMEHAENGDLRSYLLNRRERNPPSYRQALQICLASAKTMASIHMKHVVHNQLRAEHLLVGRDHECIKVTGFGRARLLNDKTFEKGYEVECLEPHDPSIRWTPPKGLQNPSICSYQSDIWAFGILMYEIITCGGLPYADKNLKKVREDVLAGRYLLKEENMKDGYYTLMQRCFGQDPLSFGEIYTDLQKLLNQCDKKDDRPMKIPENIATVHKEADHVLYKNVTADDTTVSANQQPEDTTIAYQNVNWDAGDKIQKTRLKKLQVLKDDSIHHTNKLVQLDHPHLAKIFKVKKQNSLKVISQEYPGQSLGEHLKSHRYTVDDLTRFCAQICAALNYLHSQNIVHCNLTPDNVVVVNGRHVKLAGLQYTKSLRPYHNNANVSICSFGGDVEPQLYRWHAQEVIQEGLFSKESDIWSLGMVMWAIFSNLDDGLDLQDIKPLSQYEDHEILEKLKYGLRPRQTSQCPDWVYIVMTQCWLQRTYERASSLSILECLTQRTPWETYVLQNWHRKHSADICENWPNMSITQRCADEFVSPSRQDVIRSASDEFTANHSYYYVPWSFTRRLRNVAKNIKSAVGITPSSSKRTPSSMPSSTASSSNGTSRTSTRQKPLFSPPPIPETSSSENLTLSSSSSSSSSLLSSSITSMSLPDLSMVNKMITTATTHENVQATHICPHAPSAPTEDSESASSISFTRQVDELRNLEPYAPSAPPEDLQSISSPSSFMSLPLASGTEETLEMYEYDDQVSIRPPLYDLVEPSAPPEEEDYQAPFGRTYQEIEQHLNIDKVKEEGYEPIASTPKDFIAPCGYMPFYKTLPSPVNNESNYLAVREIMTSQDDEDLENTYQSREALPNLSPPSPTYVTISFTEEPSDVEEIFV